MKLFNTLALAGVFLLSATGAWAARGEDPEADALYDLNLGMAGLKQANKDPALLAQLMQDMQDPAMMAEAKKMMDSPEWKKQMKKMEQSKEFKESVKKTSEMMKDPSTSARMQAQMEHMVKRGQDSLKKEARGAMEGAMDAMAQPEVMAEAVKMMKDPAFQQQLSEMMKDPSFKNYVDAMQDMMKDPATKEQMDSMKDKFASSL